MGQAEEERPPGLRRQGKRLLWRASKAAVAAGYPVKSANLTALADKPDELLARCEKLQREMLEWMHGGFRRRALEFDGTFRSIFDLYENDARSPFHKLKPSTQHPYSVYLRMMRTDIGHCRVDRRDGRDAQDWFDGWSAPAKEGGRKMLAKANMAMAALKAALAFAVVCRKSGCAEFLVCIPKRFERSKPRRIAIPADKVTAARLAAHQQQQPGAALAYALQFEGTLRQWDVIGMWLPLSDPHPSAIIADREKWIGPTWKDVDDDLVLRWTPSKTEKSSGEQIVIDLRACPMVMEELDLTLAAGKPLSGPLVIDRKTGLPFTYNRYWEIWRASALLAEIPETVWNRDLRKSGSTEARRAGAPIDDMKKIMGHTEDSNTTQRVYDLADLEAHRRVAEARVAFRKAPK